MKNIVLNRVTKIHDADTEPLNEFDFKKRKLILFLSHRHDLVALGYVDDNLVWFSLTKTDDLLSTRRIFDCVKVGAFYRKAELETALSTAGMIVRDLQSMCHINIDNMESGSPVLSGCVSLQIDNMTSVCFAEYVAVLPSRLIASIDNIGTVNDILTELDKDYDYLQSLYAANDSYDSSKYEKASAVCDKWRSVECLNMSDRASVRELYRDVCYHEAGIERQCVTDIKSVN